jgi:nucleoid-associated protein YgaU
MNKVLKYVVMVGILLALVLTSACTLRASKPPASQATATSELLFLTSTTVSDAVATQTAAVKPAVATATTEPKAVEQPTAAPTEAQAGGGQTVSENQAQAQPIPTLSRPSTYALQKGEWPICIARRYDLNLSSLFSLNGYNMNSRPQVGAVMKIPSTGNWDSSAHGARALRSHTDYKVQAGDTVYTIACYFGDVSPEGILAANGFSSAADVKSGNTVKIP